MIRWEELEKQRPDLAEIGNRLLFQFGPGLAFLATVRADGGPRMHPICPVRAGGGLLFFGRPQSPKVADLLRDGRFALHNFPPPPEGEDEEFYCTGRVVRVEDAALRELAIEAALHKIHPEDECFEFLIDRVLNTKWENFGKPDIKPHHTKWQAPA